MTHQAPYLAKSDEALKAGSFIVLTSKSISYYTLGDYSGTTEIKKGEYLHIVENLILNGYNVYSRKEIKEITGR
jgi:hypothetical protein